LSELTQFFAAMDDNDEFGDLEKNEEIFLGWIEIDMKE